MNANSVFAKTSLGRTAISDRNVPLSPKQRQLLIMIDGKRKLKDIFPNLDETALARIHSLAIEGLIDGDGLTTGKPQPASERVNKTTSGLQVTRLPSVNDQQRIRRILAMCSQQYLSDELDTMLTDVFDTMLEPSELQFCLDQWLSRMQSRQPESATNMYVLQIKSLL